MTAPAGVLRPTPQEELLMARVYATLVVAGALLLVSLGFLASPETFKKAPFPFFFIWIVWALPLFRFLIPILCCVAIYRAVTRLREAPDEPRR
jgi:hypothetical protein